MMIKRHHVERGYKMYDIHSHILFNIDDGAATKEDSIKMAKAAMKEGITKIVATPHHKNGYFDNYKNDIEKGVEQLNQLFLQEQINLEVLTGQEVRIHEDLFDSISRGDILTINDSQYLLLELPFYNVPDYTVDMIKRLKDDGITPIIAHPERQRLIREDISIMNELIEAGALSQITAGSLLGEFGEEAQKFSHELIQNQIGHIIATDAHDTGRRGFVMSEALKIVQERYGNEQYEIFISNSNKVVKDKVIK